MDPLTWEETAPLGEALGHPSPAVRLAALRALVRLPLEKAVWLQLSSVALELLGHEPAGASFNDQTLGAIPFNKALNAAIYIPTRSVRQKLYHFLTVGDPEIRAATARALAIARDSTAVSQLVAELTNPEQANTEDVAVWLSLLDVTTESGKVRAAYTQAQDGDVRFWLAIALAGTGESEPIEQVFSALADGELELRANMGDPMELSEILAARGPFPEEVRTALKRYTNEENNAHSVAAIATDLYWAGIPQEETAAEDEFEQPPLDDPGLTALATSISGRVQEGLDLESADLETLRPEVLPYLPAASATRVATALFSKNLFGEQFDPFIGNEIVRGIYDCRRDFWPDIPGLYQLYFAEAQLMQDETAIRPPFGFRWQVAWTVARAGLADVIQELAGILRGDRVPQIILAARLIEDVARYHNQEYPPLFGGGSSPADLVPNQELIDDLGYHEALDEGVKGFEEPKTRGFGFAEQPGSEEEVFDSRSGEEKPRYSFDLGDIAYEDSEPEVVEPGGGEEALEGLPSKSVKSQERTVNTGFSAVSSPDQDLTMHVPLQAGEQYFFWLSIGKRDVASLETGPSPQVHVPLDATIRAALFGFEDGLILTPGADIGELRERGGESMEPIRQPLGEKTPQIINAGERLYFPVRAPAEPGEYRMRCNLYWGQILLQSRLVEVLVEVNPVAHGEEVVLRVTPDYTIAPSLNPAHLRQLPEHRLSVLMNQNQDGTHSFHFLGAENGRLYKNDDIRFGENELQDMITTARKKLRRVSWDSEEEWRDKEQDPYRYQDQTLKIDRLKADLINLAQWGYAFYDAISQRLAGHNGIDEYDLQDLMVKPGLVQIALKELPSYILPVSLIYDYDLDVGAPDLSLCPMFEAAVVNQQALEETTCFQGNCPSRGDLKVICPSGFWGFRHYLGTPLTVVNTQDKEEIGEKNNTAPDIPPVIEIQGELRLAAGVATNLDFTESHIKKISNLRTGTHLDYADNRDRVIEVLKGNPHVVYFYCHGGYAGTGPYLQVGSEDDPQIIDPTNIKAYKIRWDSPRPLVFINGCHTTSVAPLQALQFISPLVTRARCAGVIGTEITIFEELATRFAEACLGRFYAGESIGEAIRNARLALLQEGNPLGLVYIPFVMAGLRLVEIT